MDFDTMEADLSVLIGSDTSGTIFVRARTDTGREVS